MKLEKALITLGILTLVLIVTNFIEEMLTSYGAVNPIYAGISIPVVTALIIFIIIYVLEQGSKAEVL